MSKDFAPVKDLLEQGADAGFVSGAISSWHRATGAGHFNLRDMSSDQERPEARKELITLLVNYQPTLLDSVTPQNVGKDTALHRAAIEIQDTALNTLLNSGANKDIQNNSGAFPYDIAKEACKHGFTHKAQKLDQHPVDPISEQTLNRLKPTKLLNEEQQRHELVRRGSIAAAVAIAMVGTGYLVYKKADIIKGWFKKSQDE